MSQHAEIEKGIAGYGGVDGALLRCPYNEQLVEDLKATIPRDGRRWQPEEKCWWIEADHLDKAVAVLLRYHTSVMVLGEGGEGDELINRDGSRATQGRLL